MGRNSLVVFDDYYLGDKKILSTFGSNSTYKKINTNKYQKA